MIAHLRKSTFALIKGKKKESEDIRAVEFNPCINPTLCIDSNEHGRFSYFPALSPYFSEVHLTSSVVADSAGQK